MSKAGNIEIAESLVAGMRLLTTRRNEALEEGKRGWFQLVGQENAAKIREDFDSSDRAKIIRTNVDRRFGKDVQKLIETHINKLSLLDKLVVLDKTSEIVGDTGLDMFFKKILIDNQTISHEQYVAFEAKRTALEAQQAAATEAGRKKTMDKEEERLFVEEKRQRSAIRYPTRGRKDDARIAKILADMPDLKHRVRFVEEESSPRTVSPDSTATSTSTDSLSRTRVVR